jgi:hypothetical protein
VVPRGGAIYGLEIEDGKLYMFGVFPKNHGDRSLSCVIVCDLVDFEADDVSYVGSFRVDKVDIDLEGQARPRHLGAEPLMRTQTRHILMVAVKPTIIAPSSVS